MLLRNPAAGDESPPGRLSPRLRLKLRRAPRPLVSLLVSWLGHAAESPASTEPKDVAPESRGGRAISAHIAEAMRAQLPAFKPPPPPPPTPVAEPGPSVPADAPVIMEKVVVIEKKVPTVGEFQILSKAGQAAYLQKQFPGAVVPGPDPLTEATPNYAAQMLRDKIRLERLRDLEETVDTLRATGDIAASNRLKEEMQRALIRRHDWRDERLDRSYNRDRR